MVGLTEAEDLHEIIRNVARDHGRDMTDMHHIADEVMGMPVGDSTPVPGTLILEPTLVLPPALHEGINEPPEGKFWLPPFRRAPGFHFSVGDLQKRLTRTRVWLAVLTMYAISATIVIAVNW